MPDNQLCDMAAKRQIAPDDLIRKAPSTNWVPAARIRGLFDKKVVTGVVIPQNTRAPEPSPVSPGFTDFVAADFMPPQAAKSERSLSHLVPCPDCANRISPSASSCPHCGFAFFRPSRSTAIALAWTLGGIGIHKFYLRRPGDGIAALLFCWTFIPAIVAFAEGFQFLSMNDETFGLQYGHNPLANRNRYLSNTTVGSDKDARQRIKGLAFVAVVLAIIAAPVLYFDNQRVATNTLSSQSNNVRNSRPRLYDKTALDWQTGSRDDKLATCRFYLRGVWQGGALKPHIHNSIRSVEDLEPYVRELVTCLDAATRPVPDPDENRRVFSQIKLHQIAAIGMVTMGWGE